MNDVPENKIIVHLIDGEVTVVSRTSRFFEIFDFDKYKVLNHIFTTVHDKMYCPSCREELTEFQLNATAFDYFLTDNKLTLHEYIEIPSDIFPIYTYAESIDEDVEESYNACFTCPFCLTPSESTSF